MHNNKIENLLHLMVPYRPIINYRLVAVLTVGSNDKAFYQQHIGSTLLPYLVLISFNVCST